MAKAKVIEDAVVFEVGTRVTLNPAGMACGTYDAFHGLAGTVKALADGYTNILWDVSNIYSFHRTRTIKNCYLEGV